MLALLFLTIWQGETPSGISANALKSNLSSLRQHLSHASYSYLNDELEKFEKNELSKLKADRFLTPLAKEDAHFIKAYFARNRRFYSILGKEVSTYLSLTDQQMIEVKKLLSQFEKDLWQEFSKSGDHTGLLKRYVTTERLALLEKVQKLLSEDQRKKIEALNGDVMLSQKTITEVIMDKWQDLQRLQARKSNPENLKSYFGTGGINLMDQEIVYDVLKLTKEQREQARQIYEEYDFYLDAVQQKYMGLLQEDKDEGKKYLAFVNELSIKAERDHKKNMTEP